MKKEKKSIELDDLLTDEIEHSTNDRDMIIVNSRAEQEPEAPNEGRMSRLQNSEIIEEGEVYGHDEPVYEDVDLGEIKVDGGKIHRERHKEEKEAFEENKKDMKPVLSQLEGEEPEDITELDSDMQTAEEKIEREKVESAHKKNVDKIISDLLR